jgi:hypothetical protein
MTCTLTCPSADVTQWALTSVPHIIIPAIPTPAAPTLVTPPLSAPLDEGANPPDNKGTMLYPYMIYDNMH